MENKYFSKSLADFTFDVASAGAIRHLADRGYTVKEIKNNLSYPATEKQIQEVVWKRYLETGIVKLSEPDNEVTEKVTFVKETGEYGKTSFRCVREKIVNTENEYTVCTFGIVMREDAGAFADMMKLLETSDAEYIKGILWPDYPVYHVMNERMKRIKKRLE